MAQVFKIRRKSDGLFSTGGTWPKWTKRGKTWVNRGGLTNHLGLVRSNKFNGDPYKDAELITYDLIEVEVDVQTIGELRAEVAQRAADREAAQQARREQWQRQERLKQYESLKKEFG